MYFSCPKIDAIALLPTQRVGQAKYASFGFKGHAHPKRQRAVGHRCGIAAAVFDISQLAK